MKQITNIRKAVCTMANELKKEGYTLSQAFRKAWRRIKLSMKIRAVGTTAGNIQERLGFMKPFPVDTMQAELVREPENPFDKNAIKIVVHLRSINRKTVIGYVPGGLAAGLAAVIDAGVNVKAELLQILGGYSYKESYGCLLDITISMPEISEVIQYFLANNRGLAPAAAFGQKERGKRWLN